MISLPVLLDFLNSNYLNKFNTSIKGGYSEPFYKAFANGEPAEIQFSYDHLRSALHELAHWCVAGKERRKIDDYGYWYTEDGRTQEQQEAFFKAEIKPQAIEWAFSILCGVKFEVSVDNLYNSVMGVDQFKKDVRIQFNRYLVKGFNTRTTDLIHTLSGFKRIESPFSYLKKTINHC